MWKFLSTNFFLWCGLLLALSMLSGCASFGRGVVEGLLSDKEEVDTRECFIRGRPFAGLESAVAKQLEAANSEGNRTLKVLMVHGIGSHQPGYSTRLAENLARALSLNRTREKIKEFQLVHPDYPESTLGVLRVSAYLGASGDREMIFYELTWDPIVEEEKQTIEYDNSGAYAFRRTTINDILKLFVNATVPDVLMYNGRFREQTQVSVSQALCRMLSDTWDSLPEDGESYCDYADPDFISRLQDDYFFVTHSLGSRITADALQRIAIIAQNYPELSDKVKLFQEKVLTVFMLSNQLPLLQLGQARPEVAGQIDAICSTGAPKAKDRLFKETRFVAFSDPNDLFSYSIPPKYMDNYMDSRLCPTLTNVILNVAPVTDVLGLGEFANPMKAHSGYDNDERVIRLLSRGIGTENVDPLVEERCEWLEALP